MPAILFGNMKGGVGKTTNSVMTAYHLARKGYKTLVCDLDPQANATQLLRRTYGLQNDDDLKIDQTMMVALSNEDKASQQVECDIQQEQKDNKRPVGRPKSGRKSYKTVRLQKETVEKINALENAFGLKTQDEAVNHAIDLVIRNMSTDEHRGYDLWLQMLEKKGK